MKGYKAFEIHVTHQVANLNSVQTICDTRTRTRTTQTYAHTDLNSVQSNCDTRTRSRARAHTHTQTNTHTLTSLNFKECELSLEKNGDIPDTNLSTKEKKYQKKLQSQDRIS